VSGGPSPPRPLRPSAFSSDVPARLDRLPWSGFHTLVVAALGISWILDGLEVTLVGALSPAIARTLSLGDAQIGWTGTAYVLGAVAGALVFGRLADRFGRKRLFTVTVAVYLLATLATGLSWSFASLLLFRFLTGAGIGGEYGAVNSAIAELTPARRRGWVDLAVNGSFWIGAALGAVGSVAALDPRLVGPALGWRLAFIVGAALALVVLWLRRFIPESPRWLMTHGRPGEAAAVVARIEAGVWRRRGEPAPTAAAATLEFRARAGLGWAEVAAVLLGLYRRRTILVLTLMAAQAFCYNAVFFTYALVLARFYAVPAAAIGWYILPFALGNFAGPLLLGPLFDRVGRKPMIALAYGLAGALLALTGALFAGSRLGAQGLTWAWSLIFFFASAGASAAYLTAGEAFPLEIRAVAISLFYAFGSLLGAGGPALFGALVGSGERLRVFWGYLFAGALMAAASAVELRLGIAAERRSLEDIAPPLSLEDGREGAAGA
jgi:MFS family permease